MTKQRGLVPHGQTSADIASINVLIAGLDFREIGTPTSNIFFILFHPRDDGRVASAAVPVYRQSQRSEPRIRQVVSFFYHLLLCYSLFLSFYQFLFLSFLLLFFVSFFYHMISFLFLCFYHSSLFLSSITFSYVILCFYHSINIFFCLSCCYSLFLSSIT